MTETVSGPDVIDTIRVRFERKADSLNYWKEWKSEVNDGAFEDHSNSLGAGGRAFESPRPDHSFQSHSRARTDAPDIQAGALVS